MSLYGSSLAPHSRPSLSLVSIMRAVSPTSEDITGGSASGESLMRQLLGSY